jgi:hypothetical protein
MVANKLLNLYHSNKSIIRLMTYEPKPFIFRNLQIYDEDIEVIKIHRGLCKIWLIHPRKIFVWFLFE